MKFIHKKTLNKIKLLCAHFKTWHCVKMTFPMWTSICYVW